MKYKWILCCFMALGLSGCATIFSGTTQTINVKVVDRHNQALSDVQCSVTDGSGGGYTISSNPGTVKVSRTKGSVVIRCDKAGYRQLNTLVGDSFNPVTLVNILFWPGFIVDAVSGSYRKYPSHYLVTLEKIRK